MTARPILARWERVRRALPHSRHAGKMLFWTACLYLTEYPITQEELAQRMDLTSAQCRSYLRIMEQNGFCTRLNEGTRGRAFRFFATPKLFDFLQIEAPAAP